MDAVQERIDEWLLSGLIDAETATRLTAAEAERAAGERGSAIVEGTQPVARSAALADVFGPAPIIAEMFAYLGAGFLLAAWTSFVTRLSGDGSGLSQVGGGLMVAAAVLTGLGLVLRQGDERRRRGAGVAFLAATGYAAAAATGLISGLDPGGPTGSLVVSIVAICVAAAFRFIHPALLTQLGLIVSVTAFGGLLLAWLQAQVAPVDFTEKGEPIGIGPDPILLVVVSAAVWLLVALGLGALALTERSDHPDDGAASAAAARRAALTRAWAGIVAVAGLASALTRSDLLASGEYGRVIPPWVAQIALLILTGILVERAFRRNSTAFLAAAGLGLIIALTDFNFTFLSSSTEIGLLIEGAILLAVGVVADRLRRRLPGAKPETTLAAGEGDPPAIAGSPA
ncbi:MAG TPA: hypothetical protein VM427_02690 [Patescibacteria group bacterium]|nr:hypothetical protein [Patescibacteria group bacterium]